MSKPRNAEGLLSPYAAGPCPPASRGRGRFPRGQGSGLPKHTVPNKEGRSKEKSVGAGGGEVRGPAAAASARVRRGLRSRGGGPEVLPPSNPLPIRSSASASRVATRAVGSASSLPLPPFFFLLPSFPPKTEFRKASPAPRPAPGPTAGSSPSPTAAFHPPRSCPEGSTGSFGGAVVGQESARGASPLGAVARSGGAVPKQKLRFGTSPLSAVRRSLPWLPSARLRVPNALPSLPGIGGGLNVSYPGLSPTVRGPGLDGAERPDGLFFHETNPPLCETWPNENNKKKC